MKELGRGRGSEMRRGITPLRVRSLGLGRLARMKGESRSTTPTMTTMYTRIPNQNQPYPPNSTNSHTSAPPLSQTPTRRILQKSSYDIPQTVLLLLLRQGRQGRRTRAPVDIATIAISPSYPNPYIRIHTPHIGTWRRGRDDECE
jgi:hypothetical protein